MRLPKKIISDTVTIALMYLKREPQGFLVLFALPVLLIILISVLTEGRYTAQAFIGAITMTTFYQGVTGGSFDISNDRYAKRLAFYVAAPVHPLSYALGTSTAYLLPCLIINFVLLTMAQVLRLFNILHLPYTIMAIFLTWGVAVSIGFFIGSYIMDLRSIGPLSNFVAFVMIFGMPVFYPLEYLPTYLRYVVYVAPTTHVAEILRFAFGLPTSTDLMYSVVFLVLTTILFMALTLKKVRWREK